MTNEAHVSIFRKDCAIAKFDLTHLGAPPIDFLLGWANAFKAVQNAAVITAVAAILTGAFCLAEAQIGEQEMLAYTCRDMIPREYFI
jgi:hypothetical protein